MKEVKTEDLIINLLIYLYDEYNKKTITSIQLQKYKDIIKKNNKNIIIDNENPYIFKEKYNKYFNVFIIVNDFAIYEIKEDITKDTLRKKFSFNYKEELKTLEFNNFSKTCNHLVRDNIPKILKDKTDKIDFYVLDKKNYKEELYRNLEDAYQSFVNSSQFENKINSGVDIISLLSSIIELEVNEENKLKKEVEKKEEVEGKFDKRLFIEEIDFKMK